MASWTIEGRVGRHLLGPVFQSAEIGWKLPERLLPPHAADDEANDEPAKI